MVEKLLNITRNENSRLQDKIAQLEKLRHFLKNFHQDEPVPVANKAATVTVAADKETGNNTFTKLEISEGAKTTTPLKHSNNRLNFFQKSARQTKEKNIAERNKKESTKREHLEQQRRARELQRDLHKLETEQIPFKDPKALIREFTDLEEKSLFLIEKNQENEHSYFKLIKVFRETKIKKSDKIKELTQKRQMLKAKIQSRV